MTPKHGSIKTETIQLTIAGENFSIERVANIDSLIDEIASDEFNADERLPYWAQLWASSIALAEYIGEKGIRGKSFIELGAGLGLVSLVASKYFGHVLCTDYERPALELAEKNAARNRAELRRVEYKLLDWRSTAADGLFDVVAGADLLYEERNLKPILNFLLEHTGGFALIADPHRKTADGFFTTAERDFEMEFEENTIVLDDVSTGVRVCRLTPRRR